MLRVARIQETVARRYGVEREAIVGRRQAPPELVKARHMAMLLSCILSHHTQSRVAQLFNRDHATVFHARRKMELLLGQDEAVFGEALEIIRELAD